MTSNEVFSAVAANQVKGMMLHDGMADYYDFLGLKGFKRMHEYHFLREAVGMRAVHRYYINHYGTLLQGAAIDGEEVIPEAWQGARREDVNLGAKQNAVKTCMEKWATWERAAKAMYEDAYRQLFEIGEIAAAKRMSRLVCDADEELKRAERMCIDMGGVGYDMEYVLSIQDGLHKKYRNKAKKLEVETC